MLRVVVCPFIGQSYRAPCPVCIFDSADTHADGDALRHATRLLYKECSIGHGFVACIDRHWSSNVWHDHGDSGDPCMAVEDASGDSDDPCMAVEDAPLTSQ